MHMLAYKMFGKYYLKPIDTHRCTCKHILMNIHMVMHILACSNFCKRYMKPIHSLSVALGGHSELPPDCTDESGADVDLADELNIQGECMQVSVACGACGDTAALICVLSKQRYMPLEWTWW